MCAFRLKCWFQNVDKRSIGLHSPLGGRRWSTQLLHSFLAPKAKCAFRIRKKFGGGWCESERTDLKKLEHTPVDASSSSAKLEWSELGHLRKGRNNVWMHNLCLRCDED